MPRAERSLESRIADHEKYRRQCKIRLKPYIVVSVVVAAGLGYMLWRDPGSWYTFVAIVGISWGLTAMEIRGFCKHERALRELRSGANVGT